ncbi:MAG: FAD-dependent oxidoreductase [Methanobacteriales archaeon HGW-Methanobacteriales-1]|nr:MAG: FAD-dependent oxidoreductase [Methanobacteriales archaeon HGW-Methanobacteriales-1]
MWKKVVVIESDRIVKDVTASTTAKISAHTFYSLQIPNIGEEKTKLYAKANMNAVETVAALVSEYDIDCDFRRVPCYFYTESEEEIDLFKSELEFIPKLGVPAEYTTDIPTSKSAKSGLVYKNQAEFHPRKYLMALASEIPGNGSYLFENTRFLDLKELITGEEDSKKLNEANSDNRNSKSNQYQVTTDQGSIYADNVVMASHFPVYDPDGLYNHLKITRSYILACYSNEEFPEAMFICVNPFNTYRSTPTKNGRLIIIAGEHQIVGEKNTRNCYRHLEKYVRDNFDIKSIEYHWVNQDNGTPDARPIIGETSQKGVYMATGFGGWGMTHGTTSARLITI